MKVWQIYQGFVGFRARESEVAVIIPSGVAFDWENLGLHPS